MEHPRDPITQQFCIKILPYKTKQWHHLDIAWANWLIGFIDGEGCFQIDKRHDKRKPTTWNCQTKFNITQRGDKKEFLNQICTKLDIGRVYQMPETSLSGKHNHIHILSYYIVSNMADCQTLVSFLDIFPPRIKWNEYQIWRKAVLELAKGKERNLDYFEYLHFAIRWLRQYQHSIDNLYPYNSDWRKYLNT